MNTNELKESIISDIYKFVKETEKKRLQTKNSFQIDKELLESLMIINKQCKIYSHRRQEAYLRENDSMVEMYIKKRDDLYQKKQEILENLIQEYNIKPIGYHIHFSKTSNLNSQRCLPLYIINNYEFHLEKSFDFAKENNLKFLGIMKNSYENKFNEYSSFQNAMSIIDDFLF